MLIELLFISAVISLRFFGDTRTWYENAGSRDRRSDVTGEQETAHVRRRRPPGNGPPSTTRNSTSTSPFRLIVYQLTRRSAAFSNRRGW